VAVNYKHPDSGERLIAGEAVSALLGFKGLDYYGSLVAASALTRAVATQLSTGLNEVVTAAVASASTLLPVAAAGNVVFVANAGSNLIRVFGTGTDTINGMAGSTGVAQASATQTIYFSPRAGIWYSK